MRRRSRIFQARTPKPGEKRSRLQSTLTSPTSDSDPGAANSSLELLGWFPEDRNPVPVSSWSGQGFTVQKFDLEKRKVEKILEGLAPSQSRQTARRCSHAIGPAGAAQPRFALPR
jgi:hypothetical protein